LLNIYRLLANTGVVLKTKLGGSLTGSIGLTQIGMNHDVGPFLLVLNDRFVFSNVELNDKMYTKRTRLQRLTLPTPKKSRKINKP
jgi:hypothetical protein